MLWDVFRMLELQRTHNNLNETNWKNPGNLNIFFIGNYAFSLIVDFWPV